MDKAVLVNLDIEAGAKIIEALDESGLTANVALWAVLSEYGYGRLILASRYFDDGASKAYPKVLGALQERGIGSYDDPDLLVLKMTDPFVQELRKLFGKAKNVAGVRLGGQSFGDRFIEDGYVYRIR